MIKLTLVRNALSQGQAYRALVDGFYRKRRNSNDEVNALSKEEILLYLKPSNIVNAFNARLVDLTDPDALAVGQWINRQKSQPDFLISSPTLRARQTVSQIEKGGSRMKDTPWIIDERVIGQNFGDAYEEDGIESFFYHHPQERINFKRIGVYDYVFPGGESLANTYQRAVDWVNDSLIKYRGLNICVVADESFFVCVRSVIEKWNRNTFLRIAHDPKLRPHNCVITHYSDRGTGLFLRFYNRKECAGENK